MKRTILTRDAVVMLLAVVAVLPSPIWGAEPGGPRIPFPMALDEAAVVQERLDDVLDNSLILGNGDINALLFATRAGLTLNLTKNDVWDARVDSSAEKPLLKVDIAAHRMGRRAAGQPERL